MNRKKNYSMNIHGQDLLIFSRKTINYQRTYITSSIFIENTQNKIESFQMFTSYNLIIFVFY